MKKVSRRGFINSASIGVGTALGAAAFGETSYGAEPTASDRSRRLPREVWIASITQNGLQADNHEQMTDMLIGRMQEVVPLKPDIICLPEISPFNNLTTGRPEVAEIAEKLAGPVKARLAEFAKAHNCYLWCPVYTKENGRFYNAVVLLDRQGKELGEYRKMRPTAGECDNGISPGAKTPPVFETDFGRIGAQICFDIEWLDGWQKLQQAGAEIVFWSSAFGGGSKLNMLAGMFRYNIVSSTIKGTSKLCDITGETLASTGLWQEWLCAPVNLERAYLHTWPFNTKLEKARNKYGRAIRITHYHEEEWAILESRSPEIKVRDVLKEFDIPTYDEVLEEAEARQEQMRG